MTSVPIDRVIDQVRRTLKRGDIVRTVGMVRQLAQQAGHDPRSRHLQAVAALEFGQAREAVGLLETLVFELTGEALSEATIDLAHARELQGDLENAMITLRPELEAESPSTRAVALSARLSFAMGEAQQALTTLDGAETDDKNRHELARAFAHIALHTREDDPERAAREDRAIGALRAESERVGVPASSLMPLLIELGELLARRGEDADAAKAWKRSAGLSPNNVDPRPYAQSVMGLINSWNDKALARARVNESGPAATTERPVFIVGMPGAGAQLAADLLASSERAGRTSDPEALTAAVGRHLAPAGANNQPVVPDPSRLNLKQLEAAAKTYLDRTDAAPGDPDPDRVIDPFELNLHSLGVVAQMFPKASVVFVKRTAFDACLACMLAHRDPRLLHAHDPQGLAVFAGGVARLADHWAGVFGGERLPLRHTVVDHESLVNDPAARRALFEAVGLDAPADETLDRVAAEHARWTRARTGLADRFASHLPQLEHASGQIGIDRI